MFGMGMTLTVESFAFLRRRPLLVALGCALQFSIMPASAWLIAKGLAMPPDLAVGMVLVGSCPGGTASNVVCYLGRGDVALSITLTAASTLLAVAATPLLTAYYVGQTVPVPRLAMLLDIAKVIVLPVLLGIWLNTYWRVLLEPVKRWLPLVSVAAIVLIIAIIVALNHARLAGLGLTVVVGVVLHNATGLAGGYLVPWLLRLDARTCRTLAIEVGMQNSGLAVALAGKYFAPAAALPGAVFSIWHNLSGIGLASHWARRG